MGTVISNLKAKFGVETSDFKKGLKDGESAISDFKGTAGSILDDFAGMFGVNMSSVNDAISTAGKSLNFLGQSFKGAAKGGDVLAISAKLLKVALISTGIGAIVVGLGSLIAYFTKSGEGADRFAKILAQVKSVFNNVIDRIMQLGKGLFDIFSGKFKQGWEEMTSAFKGMGEEIKEDWKAAGQLADAEDTLEDKEIALINSLEERRAKIADLKRQSKEEIDDQQKKLSLLNQVEKLTKSVYGDQVALETERLRIMKEKLAIQTSDPTDEQTRAIAEQQAKINALLREENEDLRANSKERNTAIKSIRETTQEQTKLVGSIKNLKMPDEIFSPYRKSLENIKETLNQLQHTYIQTTEAASALFEVMGQVGVDAAGAINEAFTAGLEGFGEFLGQLGSGQTSMSGFGKLLLGTFADLAINIGKIAIGAGLAVLGIKQALMTLNPAVAIIAGTALVALGYAVKGALSSAASGSSGGGSSASSAVSSAGSSSSVKPQAITINVTGTLKGDGRSLKATIDEVQNLQLATT